MRIFIDTNILLDYICHRDPFYEDAKSLIKLCMEGDESGVIAAHSICNIDYIAQKLYSMEERRVILHNLCTFLYVESVDKEKLISAIENMNFADLEDGIQYECAVSQETEYIITRNKKDFLNSSIPVLTAQEFLGLRNNPLPASKTL